MDTEKKENLKEVIEWIICIIVAVVLALLVRHFIFTPTVVRQESMRTTLEPGDRLILDRLSITLHKEIKRGDIITFEAPTVKSLSASQINPDNPVAIYKNEPTNIFSKFTYYVLEWGKESYIKRVIGVAGDHVVIKDGKVYVNDEELKEDYLRDGIDTRSEVYDDIIVPDGYIFAMGDNRVKSTDCRAFGCIPVDKVESKVLVRFWPFNKLGKIPSNS